MLTQAFTAEETRSGVAALLRVAIGIVWLYAAVQKSRAPTETRNSIRRLAGGVGWAEPLLARILPWAELALGVSLVAGWHARLAAVLSAVLFVLFAIAVGRAAVSLSLIGGGCGCFGARSTTDDHPDMAGPRAVARNLVLAALALAGAGR